MCDGITLNLSDLIMLCISPLGSFWIPDFENGQLLGLPEASYGVSASAVADDATDGPGKIALKGGRGPADIALVTTERWPKNPCGSVFCYSPVQYGDGDDRRHSH